MITQVLSLFIAIPLLAAGDPKSVSIMDFVEKRCVEGDQRSCERMEELNRDAQRHKRLLDYSVRFSDTFRGENYTYNNKPDLESAYPVVLSDFFSNETESGFEDHLKEDRVPQCASHYHNHWRNRKLWWPINDEGAPDWQRIYVYVVDHYYGYCLRRS